MTKTLIGNIKGKNGRGITSIKKTGTTGSVDTYTIAYTDSTTSTFTVNNADNIALQRQIVPTAAVESSTTASQAYAAGDYVVVNGLLRKVKTAIVKGGAISDSNSAATTVTRELAALAVPRTQTRLSDSVMCYVEGGICVISVDFLAVNEAATTCQIATLPSGLKPLGGVYAGDTVAYIAPLQHRGDDTWHGQLMVTNSGSITAWANVADAGGYYYGNLVFPVKR